VDDDPSIRSLLKVALPLGDAEVEVVAEASDGNEAVELAESVCPDLIILDHMMPRRTGASALPRIKRVSPNSEVIFFTAYLDAIEAGEVLKRAARDYEAQTVPKGSLVELEAAVARVAHSRIF
jgi:two-component system response regulator YesN